MPQRLTFRSCRRIPNAPSKSGALEFTDWHAHCAQTVQDFRTRAVLQLFDGQQEKEGRLFLRFEFDLRLSFRVPGKGALHDGVLDFNDLKRVGVFAKFPFLELSGHPTLESDAAKT